MDADCPAMGSFCLFVRNFILIAGAAQIASASAVIRVVGTSPSAGREISFSLDGRVVSDYAGGITITSNNVTSSVLCVDLFTVVRANDTFAVDYLQPQYLDPADAMTGLRAAYLMVTQYGRIDSLVSSLRPSISLAEASAGLQLAIWDIVHDGGDGLAAGRVRTSSVSGSSTPTAVRVAANAYIQYAVAFRGSQVNATLYRHVSGPSVKQQLIGFEQPGTGAPIPEPGSFALVLGALACIGWRSQWYPRNGTGFTERGPNS
jgi:hypothetical protein